MMSAIELQSKKIELVNELEKAGVIEKKDMEHYAEAYTASELEDLLQAAAK